jgi:hypothetical protein
LTALADGPSSVVREIGVISDTHGLLRPEALRELDGCDLILHAGDVGRGGILEELAELAPVRAVRGNVDRGDLGALPLTEAVDVGGHLIYMIHILEELDLDPGTAGVHLLVHGHTHRPRIGTHRGVAVLNPGSAGHRRFDLPVTLARVRVDSEGLHPRIVEMDV